MYLLVWSGSNRDGQVGPVTAPAVTGLSCLKPAILDVATECLKLYGEDFLPDGILNPTLYWESKPRIFWLLRETWHPGSWQDLKAPGVYQRLGASPTWHVMTYVTFSLQNGFPLWREMDYIREEPQMAECLRTIAYPGKVFAHRADGVSDFGFTTEAEAKSLLDAI